ncbi:MAG TPA: MmcB family DNA repair protein [Aestuariivirga sp.]|nr:MmcB family DNA repair protein [Aestuariivirga sp.]
MTIELRPDGRQSETALAVQRGVGRLMRSLGFAILNEFTLATGRRADVIAIGDSGAIWIVEIKSSIEDFRVDQKWPEYREFCDQFFFAIPQTLDPEIIPFEAGLIVADNWGAEILRQPAKTLLHASRRKALTLAIARVSSQRLHGLYDP